LGSPAVSFRSRAWMAAIISGVFFPWRCGRRRPGGCAAARRWCLPGVVGGLVRRYGVLTPKSPPARCRRRGLTGSTPARRTVGAVVHRASCKTARLQLAVQPEKLEGRRHVLRSVWLVLCVVPIVGVGERSGQTRYTDSHPSTHLSERALLVPAGARRPALPRAPNLRFQKPTSRGLRD